jgi:hypothetical protein
MIWSVESLMRSTFAYRQRQYKRNGAHSMQQASAAASMALPAPAKAPAR